MRAVVLAGGQEYGQCPLSRQAPRALWPLLDKPIVNHVLSCLRSAGVGHMAVSANGRTHDIMDRIGHHPSPDITIHYNEDSLPRGAAGCIKDCQEWLGDQTFLVVPGAALMLNVDLAKLLAEHQKSGAALTVAAEITPPLHGSNPACPPGLKPTGLYVCEPRVLDYVKSRGYQDMKEQLIPRLVEAGLKVRAIPITGRVLSIRNEESYLNAIVELLDDADAREAFVRHLPCTIPTVWIDPLAQVHPTARVVGPAYVGAGAAIGANAVVIGPAVIGPRCQIGSDSVIHESILWPGARVGSNAMIEQTVMAADAIVPAEAEVRGSIVVETSLSTAERHSLSGSMDLGSADIPVSRRWWRRLAEIFRPQARSAV